MTAVVREYRVRVATQGASEVEGSVDFILALGTLTEPPVVTGQALDPVQNTTVSRPFAVMALDKAGALSALLSSGGRWAALGRLADVQFRDGGGSWTTYGTARLSDVGEPDGPGRYRIELSDESWKARRAKLFERADTTRLWPAGPKSRWRAGLFSPGFSADPAAGELTESFGSNHRIELMMGGPDNIGGQASPEVRSKLIEWIEADQLEELSGDEGNFRHLRLNYAGTDYEVVRFGELADGDLLASLRAPSIRRADTRLREVKIWAWIVAESAPPSTGDAYLHAPDAPPSRDLPLHIGIADASHAFGTERGWIHLATLHRRVWDDLGIRYDDDSLSNLEADSSVPHVAPRVTEVDDAERWMQEVAGPLGFAALRDGEGRRKLVDMRIPADVDPSNLPVLDATNSEVGTWDLSGREIVNSVKFRYALATTRFLGQPGLVGGPGPSGDVALDDVWWSERETDPIEGDTDIGARAVTLDLTSVQGPERDRSVPFEQLDGTLWDGLSQQVAQDLLDAFQDGAWRVRGRVGRTLAETLEEGDLVVLDTGSLQVPNPASGSRAGERVCRILSLQSFPAHAEVELLDLGPKLAPLAAPSVSLAMGAKPGSVDVLISGVPSGASATLEFAYTDSSDAPASWPQRRAGLGNGTVTFRGSPGEGWAHARVKSTAPGRIRSLWASSSLELASLPRVSSLRVTFDADGVPTLTGAVNTPTSGVRLRWAVHELGEIPDWGDPEDFPSGDLTSGIEIPDTRVPLRAVLTVGVEPWTGFSGGSVSGSAGPEVLKTRKHAEGRPWGSLFASLADGALDAFSAGDERSRSIAWAIRAGEPELDREEADYEWDFGTEGVDEEGEELGDPWNFRALTDRTIGWDVPLEELLEEVEDDDQVSLTVWFHEEPGAEGPRSPPIVLRLRDEILHPDAERRRLALIDFHMVQEDDGSVTFHWSPGVDVDQVWVWVIEKELPVSEPVDWPGEALEAEVPDHFLDDGETSFNLQVPRPGRVLFVEFSPRAEDVFVSGPSERATVSPTTQEPDRIVALDLLLSHEEGSAEVRIFADPRAESARYAFATGDPAPPWPTDGALQGGEVLTLTNGIGVVQLPADTVDLGETIRLRAAAYTGPDGEGDRGAEDHGDPAEQEAERTRFRVPQLDKTFEEVVSGDGVLGVTVRDPDGRALELHYREVVGEQDPGAWTLVTDSPVDGQEYQRSVELVPGHPSAVEFRLRYTLGGRESFVPISSAPFDFGRIPDTTIIPRMDVTADPPAASATLVGNFDTVSHKVLAAIGSMPSDAEVRAETAINGRRLTPADIGSLATPEFGQTVFLKAFPYSELGGDGEEGPASTAEFVFDLTQPVLDVTTDQEEEDPDVGRLGVTVLDPSALADDLFFRTREGAEDPVDWFLKTDAPAHDTEYQETVALVEGKTSSVAARLRYTYMGSQEPVFARGGPYDLGNIPWIVLQPERTAEDSADYRCRWQGDFNTQSAKIIAYPSSDPPADVRAAVQAASAVDGRVGVTGTLFSDAEPGQKITFAGLGYSEEAGGGNEQTELALVEVQHPGIEEPPGETDLEITSVTLVPGGGIDDGSLKRVRIGLFISSRVKSIRIFHGEGPADGTYKFNREGEDTFAHTLQDGTADAETGNELDFQVSGPSDFPVFFSVTVYAQPNGVEELTSKGAEASLAGVASASQGGTGRSEITAGRYMRGDGIDPVALLTPAEVRDDIGAAALEHNHSAEDIAAGVFESDRIALTTAGDLVFAQDGSGALNRLPIGDEGQLLSVSATGFPEWADPPEGELPDPTAVGRFLRVGAGPGWAQSAWGLPDSIGPDTQVLKSPSTGVDAEWGEVDWDELTGKPSTFAPAEHGNEAHSLNFAEESHNHGAGDITSGVFPPARLVASPAAGDLFFAIDSGTLARVPIGSSGEALVVNGAGTGYEFSEIGGGGVTSPPAASRWYRSTGTGDDDHDWSGWTLPVSVSTGEVLYANTGSSVAGLPAGTPGNVLKQGASVPAWGSVAFSELSGSLGSDQLPDVLTAGERLTLESGRTSAVGNNADGHVFASASAPGSYPFNVAGHLVLQPRTSEARDIVFMAGSTTPAVRMAIEAGGLVDMKGNAKVGGALEVVGAIDLLGTPEGCVMVTGVTDPPVWTALQAPASGKRYLEFNDREPALVESVAASTSGLTGVREWIDSTLDEQHTVTYEDGLVKSHVVGPAPT